MSAELANEELVEKAEFIMAVEGFENEERHRWDKGVDIVAESEGKILLRVITEPESRSGKVGITAVKEMSEAMKVEDYDKGVLISKGFSEGARDEMRREGIQPVSEQLMPTFKSDRLYLAMQDYINDLCQTKCGLIPMKKSDCKDLFYESNNYSCRVRLISDNASFHLERGWINLLQKDFQQLIAVKHLISEEENNS